MRVTMFLIASVLTIGSAQVPNLTESFSGTAFPPEMWTVYNQDAGVRLWTRSGAKYRTAPACAVVTSESRTLRNDD